MRGRARVSAVQGNPFAERRGRRQEVRARRYDLAKRLETVERLVRVEIAEPDRLRLAADVRVVRGHRGRQRRELLRVEDENVAEQREGLLWTLLACNRRWVLVGANRGDDLEADERIGRRGTRRWIDGDRLAGGLTGRANELWVLQCATGEQDRRIRHIHDPNEHALQVRVTRREVGDQLVIVRLKGRLRGDAR